MDMLAGMQPSSLPPPVLPGPMLHEVNGRTIVLGRMGSLEVRQARSANEVHRAQRLRYEVFVEGGRAVPSPYGRTVRRDIDSYDAVCDHLIVLDHRAEPRPGDRSGAQVVATCRLLRAEPATRLGGFYAGWEFDLAPLLAAQRTRRFVELGRACVARPYRRGRTVELLWAGIWAYVGRHRGDVLMGCASLDGTDPDAHAVPLSFLHHSASALPGWTARARPEHAVRMDPLPAEGLDARDAIRRLPPLIRAYLRLGARFGEGAVIDRTFGTTDVFAVLPTEAIGSRYLTHFDPIGRRARRSQGLSAASPSL